VTDAVQTAVVLRLHAPVRVPRDVIVAVVTPDAMPRRRHVSTAGVVVTGDVLRRRRRRTGRGGLLGVLMGLDVLAEMIGAHEALRADRADEPFLAGVGPNVPLQLVAAREPLAAEQPVAEERPLAGVPAQVRLEMRRLVVDLAAAWQVAAVHAALAQLQRGGRAEPIGLLAVRAVARAAARVAPVRARAAAAAASRRRRAGEPG